MKIEQEAIVESKPEDYISFLGENKMSILLILGLIFCAFTLGFFIGMDRALKVLEKAMKKSGKIAILSSNGKIELIKK